MAAARFSELFRVSRAAVIAMVHVRALPGTPLAHHNVGDLVKRARREAEIYVEAGVDAILVENMFDLPYVKGDQLGPEVVACMTRVCHEVRCVTPPHLPCGVQVLAGGNQAAIAIAQASNFQFVRAEGFVFGHVGDEGLTEACAGPLLRYRRAVGAEEVLVLADIKKKHCAHAMTGDVTIGETAGAAQFFLADGVVVTGAATGAEADTEELQEVLESVDLPVLVGSGVTRDNVHTYIRAHGLIVGSHFKEGGRWTGEVEPERVRQFTELVKRLREQVKD
ncbi:uncharacterized protein F13E9.13, mitochondrial-like [Portunus trituberculatus]|uniref:uncharacterized protein F13E9.13, mitochondrial-like n=1 Tax=Portunus trituberculatus TaxID=210409 RepID=UPI001E1CE578|nr:uncharacterized protein F13E9.13, mitochondrial-like [Portunus trituberculatus]XP_045133188.1 uncharacterized protein F13E9.13, mitochondrial-like [Portunus trituberculatus]